MTTTFFHPATIRLLWLQSRGRQRRMFQKLCQPRRLILSAVACILAVVWLCNAAMTIWLRESASPEALRVMLTWGLLFYAGWHFTKAAFFRPEGPFDLSPHEMDLLLSMPLRPRDMVAHQLASVTVTTLLKAGLFAALLLPDLRCVSLGFVGILLAMLMLELLRMSIQISTWGMSRSVYLTYRAAIVAALVAAGLAAGNALSGQVGTSEGIPDRPLAILMQLDASALGHVALPLRPLVALIQSEGLTATNFALAAIALAAVTGLAAGVMGLYALASQHVSIRERRNYSGGGMAQKTVACDQRQPKPGLGTIGPVWRIPRWGGAAPLAWRQLVGARRHWGSLLTAMIAPAVLASAPCFTIADANMALVVTTGTLAFYTFLLLPTALRFDFRRDLDRLATLKGFPITPAAATIGQTLAPVLITTLFQSGVLTFAIVARSLPPHHLILAMLVIIPLNVLVFGLDNLIYLLYPYRVQQEGLEIFLRTMLTFTGKGLLFAAGMAAVWGWGLAASSFATQTSHWTGGIIDAPTLFLAGMIAGHSLLAALVLYALSRTYASLDPIEGIPR